MNRCITFSIVGCLLLGIAGVVRADAEADKDAQIRRLQQRLSEVETNRPQGVLDNRQAEEIKSWVKDALAAKDAEISRLQQRLGDVESKHSQNWLTERRAEEIKSLVQDVLADADTRASLMSDGAVAGHNGKHFFLGSADGSFLLEVAGQIQFRHLSSFNHSSAVGQDEEDQGFNIRRTKLSFSGHVEAGGQWEYGILLAYNRGNGNIFAEDVVIGRSIADGMKVQAGLMKLPFLREELTSSKRQLAVERASVTEFFTLNRAEQVQLVISPMDNVKAVLAFSDGANSGNTNIGGDTVEYAFTGRIDVALAGDLKQIKDFAAWSGESFGAFVGAAFHYQGGDGFNAATVPGSANILSWTIDGSIETNGLNVFVAVMGNSISDTVNASPATPGVPGSAEVDQLGFLIQGGYMVVPDKLEPFIRYEYIDADGNTAAPANLNDTAHIITFGVNYYVKKHNAKFTADVVWLVDADNLAALQEGTNTTGTTFNPQTSSGLGFVDAVDDGTILVRLQFQLLF